MFLCDRDLWSLYCPVNVTFRMYRILRLSRRCGLEVVLRFRLDGFACSLSVCLARLIVYSGVRLNLLWFTMENKGSVTVCQVSNTNTAVRRLGTVRRKPFHGPIRSWPQPLLLRLSQMEQNVQIPILFDLDRWLCYFETGCQVLYPIFNLALCCTSIPAPMAPQL